MIDKQLLGLAGEYAVASEICRRGFYAQVVRWKDFDILAINPKETSKFCKIEVKSKISREWPSVKGLKPNDENSLLIFVDYNNKSEHERPDFYVMDSGDWQEFLSKHIKGHPKLDKIEDGYIPVWKDGYKGTVIKPEQIAEYKERWDKLEAKLL